MALILREDISAEEAIRLALRQVQISSQTPADEMWGAFSSKEDAGILDRAMDHVKSFRQTEQLRDFGS